MNGKIYTSYAAINPRTKFPESEKNKRKKKGAIAYFCKILLRIWRRMPWSRLLRISESHDHTLLNTGSKLSIRSDLRFLTEGWRDLGFLDWGDACRPLI